MENNSNNKKDFDKAHKDPKQGNPQNDQRRQQEKGQDENPKKENKNWDMAQRRQQAGPRSYNESTDSENIQNQNTEAHKEQVNNDEKVNDEEKEKGFQGYGKVGDKASERQQTIDEKDPQKDKKENR